MSGPDMSMDEIRALIEGGEAEVEEHFGRECKWCGRSFFARAPHGRFCSDYCRLAMWRSRRRRRARAA